MFASWALTGKASVIGAAAGAVAGLVAITPASGFVEPWAAIVIGGVAGTLCYGAVRLRASSGLDDSLDVVGVHGVGGTWGALATGLFATASVSGLVDNEGLFYGNASQVVDQLIAIGVVWVYSFGVTAIILKALDLTIGLRVSEEEEDLGLDITQHGERGYVMDEGGLAAVQFQAQRPPAPAPAPRVQPESAGSGAGS
jgi:ammonium transporter, Amt family